MGPNVAAQQAPLADEAGAVDAQNDASEQIGHGVDGVFAHHYAKGRDAFVVHRQAGWKKGKLDACAVS